MAFTVKLKSNKACFLKGDNFKLTPTVEGVGADPVPADLVYTWFKDDVQLENTKTTLTIENATGDNAGAYKVKVEDPAGGETVTSDAIRMVEAELIVKIEEPTHFYVPTNSDVQLTTSVKYSTGKAPSDNYTLHYLWEKDGVELGSESSLDITGFDTSKNGVYTVKVCGESEASMDSSSVKIMVASMRVLKDSPREKTVVLNKEITLPYQVEEDIVGDRTGMPKLKIKHHWYLQREGQSKPTLIGNETGEALEGFSIMPDGHLFKERATTDDHANFWCIAKLYQTVENTDVELASRTSTKCAMEVVESLHSMFRYVHPIPWRNTSFTWIGWWVFDEIVKFNEAGLEWRDRAVYSTSKYARDLETIAAAEEKYSDCTCMESRNGFMYQSKEFHKLDRETLERVLRIRETPPA